MPSGRLFTQAELDELARPVADRFTSLLDGGDREGARAVYASFEDWQREFSVGVFGRWMAKFQPWVDETHGRDALIRFQAPERLVTLGLLAGVTAEQLKVAEEVFSGGDGPRLRLDALIESGDTAAAGRAFLEVEAALRAAHDLRCDWITQAASDIYRQYGIEGLEASIRYLWKEGSWWPQAMKADLANDPRTRTISWADLLVLGNHDTISIAEDDEKLVINRVCGTCGVQQRRGRYEPPWNFALVEERHPMTWFKGRMPVYRTHIAMVHGVLPVEEVGVPWPAVDCSEKKGAPCRYSIYKDPSRTPAPFFEAVGLSPGPGGSG